MKYRNNIWLLFTFRHLLASFKYCDLKKRKKTSLIALRAVWRVQAFCFWAFVGKSYVSDVVCVAMVIIILLNDIHSELISYCQTAIKQIRLCIRTILKYFQFILNFRACEKHWSDSPGKRNINSKGRSSCTGFLLPPQWSIHRPVYLRSRDTARHFGAWSQTLSFWLLTATAISCSFCCRLEISLSGWL